MPARLCQESGRASVKYRAVGGYRLWREYVEYPFHAMARPDGVSRDYLLTTAKENYGFCQ
jgi:hypothetical protein